MSVLARGSRLVLATHNSGKVREIADLLAPFGVSVVSAGELALPEPEETEETFAGNAALKANAAAQATGLPALADDSGLCVNALGGDPGVLSARWAGPDRDFSRAMALVNERLGAAADRSAYFVCALALARPGHDTQIFEGRTDGVLIWPPRGERGFGYDPIFVPQGETQSFGEMAPAEKLPLTHRARAFAKLVAALA